MRGTPETWAKLPPLKDAMRTIAAELDASVHRALRAGLDRKHVVVDPGLGFGKRKEQNAEILAQLEALARLEVPIMVGASRKHFLAQGIGARNRVRDGRRRHCRYSARRAHRSSSRRKGDEGSGRCGG